MPALAMPAAMVTACSSAMPTSKNLSGKRSANSLSPVPDGIAAVIAAMRLSFSASSHIASPKTAELLLPAVGLLTLPVRASKLPMPWKRSGSFSANI